MKLLCLKLDVGKLIVAPRRGAWVETLIASEIIYFAPVAPRRGAWVETGLSGYEKIRRLVAPRRGAWVETGK